MSHKSHQLGSCSATSWRLIVVALSISSIFLLLAREGRSEELRFAVTDIVGLEELQTEYGGFQKALSGFSGIELRFFPVNNRTAAVESMKSKRIDVVLTGPAEYIIFRSRTKAYPIVGFSRPDYFRPS